MSASPRGQPMTKICEPMSRRRLIAGSASLLAASAISAPCIRRASAAPVTIRYATGGGVGPNEMETVIYLDWMQKNILKHYGKEYTVDMTYTRGTPEAATLLA